MLNLRILPVVCLLPLCLSLASAQDTGKADPLFDNHSVIALTITAPFPSLLKRRPNEEYLPGSIAYTDVDGSEVKIDLGIRTRGNYRRQKRVCPFPPLRINMDKSQVKATLFDKQDKLKLVAHCRDNSGRYEQGVIREYLAYRILNQLTDTSYRVRLARITYIDSEGKHDDRTQYGFFIEHKKRMAKRIGMPEIRTPKIRADQLEGPYSDLTSLFQFLIGNTDFSPIAGPKGDDCCHNSTLFGNEGAPIHSVPYDFDMSGLVDAPYAEPNPRFKLKSVRERLYRGRCMHNSYLEDSMRKFQEEREAIFALIDGQAELTAKMRKQVRRYVEDFYEIIDSDKQVQRRITSRCI
jgi:hypothetical protein